MLSTRRIRSAIVAAVVAVAVSGCVWGPRPGRVLIVERRPPPARVEVYGPAPGPGYVWIGGYWTWAGADFVWVTGRWVVPPRGYRHWEPAHWERHEHGWRFHDGRWRR